MNFLTEYLAEQRAFERHGLTEEIFEVWTDYLQGNAPRAKERLEHILRCVIGTTSIQHTLATPHYPIAKTSFITRTITINSMVQPV